MSTSLTTVVLATLTLNAGTFCTQMNAELRNVKVGEAIPAFTLKTLDGQTITHASTEGKVLAIVFIKPEQSFSTQALRTIHKALADAGDGLMILAISTHADKAGAFRDLFAKEHFSFPICLDPDRQFYGDLGVVVTPTTLLIDGKGILRYELPHLPPGFARKLSVHADFLLGKIDQARHDALLAQTAIDRSSGAGLQQAQLATARLFMRQGKVEQAVGILEKLKTSADSLQVSSMLADAYLALGRFEDAQTCITPWTKAPSPPPALAMVMGRLALHRKDFDKAEALFQDALKRSPQKARILYELGKLYEQKQDCDKALACYRQALEMALKRSP